MTPFERYIIEHGVPSDAANWQDTLDYHGGKLPSVKSQNKAAKNFYISNQSLPSYGSTQEWIDGGKFPSQDKVLGRININKEAPIRTRNYDGGYPAVQKLAGPIGRLPVVQQDYTAPIPSTQQVQKVQDGYNAMRQWANPKASQVTPAQAKFITRNGGFVRGVAAIPDIANIAIERYAPPVSRYPFLSPAGNKIADWIYPQQTGGYTGEY